MASPKKTLISLFEQSVTRFTQNPIFWEKPDDAYVSSSYGEMQARVYWFACGLLKHGITNGDKIALLSQARKDWITAELGILYTGAVNVPLSVKLESDDLLFRLEHSAAKILVTSAYQYPKLKNKLGGLKNLELVILLDPLDKYEDFEIYLGDLLERGKKYYNENRTFFVQTFNAVEENDCALISYTSGTTADPKGIMLSHKNLFVNCEQALELFKVEENFRILLILPLDHSFAHTAGMYVFIASGASLASVKLGRTPAASLKNIFTNIKEIQPDALLSVPTVAKNLRKNIENGIRKEGPLVDHMFRVGLKMAHKYFGMGWNKGTGLRWLYWPLYKVVDKFIFSAVRKNFGGKLKYFVGGGALLDVELQKFFLAIGMPMYQGYGLTEASPVISSNTIRGHKLGSSGKIVKNLEVNICNEQGNRIPVGQKGEIVVRGGNVMLGYYKNQAATRKSIRDGWLHTGDLGYFDNEGYLYVLGRYKSLLIGDDGEKYSPEGIEEIIEEKSSLIHQILIYNNQNPYTSALVYPDAAAMTKELIRRGLEVHSEEGAANGLILIREELDKFKYGNGEEKFPQRWLPATFALLEEGFTEKNQFLNSTLKIVRRKIVEYYKPRINYMYLPEGKDVLNLKNIESIKKVLKSS